MNFEQYCDILRSALEYEQKTIKSTIRWLLLGIAVLCIVLIIKRKKMHKKDVAIALTVAVVLCVAFVGAVIQFYSMTNNIETDILNCDFVQYEGAFIHDSYNTKDSFYHNVYIFDNNEKRRLRYPDYRNWYNTYNEFVQLPEGEHTGVVIYAINSNIVLGWYSNEMNVKSGIS